MKIRLLILFSFCFILFSCTRNTVKLVQYSPSGEVPGLTSFTFEFNKELAPLEKIDEWTREAFIDFEPKIEGQFKWVSPTTLIFSPDRPLEPSQNYSAVVNKAVLFGKTDYSLDIDDIKFHTAYFDVQKVDFFWTQIPHAEYKVSVQANIAFNYPVNPSALTKYLEVYKGDQPIKDFQILTTEPSDIVAVNFGEMQQTDKEQEFTVKVKKGFNSIYKKQPLADERVFSLKLAPLTRLAIQYVTTGFDEEVGWIEVGTSQKVDEESLAKFVVLKPKTDVKFIVNPESFRIEGNFNSGDMLNLLIKKGLPGYFGGKLEDDYEQDIVLADLEPSLKFANNSQHYLMLGGQENVSIQAVNMPEAEVHVYKVYENNILHFLNNNSYNYYDEDYYDYYGGYLSVDNYGKELYSEKYKLNTKENLKQQFNFNLDKALGQRFQGIYALQVNSVQDRWRQDAMFLAVSDLGVIAKQGPDELLVWVNSISGAEPVSGVTVKVISTNNQVLAEAKTDDKGIATINNFKNRIGDFSPRLITVRKDSDFNYLDLNSAGVETSRFEVGGKAESLAGYDAFVYSERNLYRPGEKMHLSAILRTNDYKVVKDMPVVVKMLAPSGKVFQQWKKITNAQGSFEQEFGIPEYVQTGEYNVELYSGADELIGTYKFSIEEFAPDKIKVSLNAEKKELQPGETLQMKVNADYLFGAPAANSKYEFDVNFSQKTYSSKNFDQFNFADNNFSATAFDNYFIEGTLDEKGYAEIKYELPKDILSIGYVRASALVSVFDVTGKTVSRALNYEIYPRNYFIGIRNKGSYFSTNQEIPFQIVSVDKKDKAYKNFKVNVELVRNEWQTVLNRGNSGRYNYRSVQKEVKIWNKELTLNEITDYKVVVSTAGDYQLRVYKAGDAHYVKTDFYVYGWSSNSLASFPVNKEGNIEIVADKKSYEPGNTAKILFMTPFSGKMLVTVERNKVLKHFYLAVKNNAASLDLPITEAFLPNVFISATLFKKHTAEQNTPLLVGHGYLNITVAKESNKLPVSIIAPEKMKPRSTHEITVKTIASKDVYITLAAVDEGILQIKNYQTPDPYAFEYSKRQLGVSGYDLYKFLLPEIQGPALSTGADMAFEMIRKRSTPLTANRFNLLSVWSGIRRTDANGEVKVKINIPQFNGEVRFMAVAYTDAKFGSAEKFSKISDDIILMPSVPRFLSQNDKINVPITLMNTTSKPQSIQLKATASSPVKISGGNSQSLQLKPNEEKQVQFQLQTGEEIGISKIKFETSGDVKILEEIEIGVRPNSPLVQESGAGDISNKAITIPVTGNYLPSTQNVTLSLSAFPTLKHADLLNRLIGYPHGCAEQTVAKLFPQLYFEELASLAAPKAFKGGNPVYFVREGIRKIESMQLYDGSIAYWPGGNYTNWWGSVFAAHFLVEAQKAGYDINQTKLDNLLSWIKSKASSKGSSGTYEYRSMGPGNQVTITKIANKEIIYSLYVLALAKKPDVALMNYYRARPALVSTDMRYMLAGAYALTNNWAVYHSLLPQNFKAEDAARETGDNFDSDIRANALMLEILTEVDPNNAQVPIITRYLTAALDRSHNSYYTTQEMCWAFMALGKAAKANANSNLKVSVAVDGKVIGNYDGKSISFSNEQLKGKNITLTPSGSGRIYYYWNIEGVKLKNDIKAEDREISVRRTYYDRNGNEIRDLKFVQGQLVVCKISLKSFNKIIYNVAITDMIPSGMEILNPRLGNTNQFNWLPNIDSNPQNMDVKDDRLLIFTTVNNNSTKSTDFYYMLRVTNTGTFQLPPIGAEAMYAPEYHSYHGGGTVVVNADK